MRIRLRHILLAVAAALVLAPALLPTTASAWTLTKSSNGATIQRDDSDTTTSTLTCRLYWGYQGGSSWDYLKNPCVYTNYDYNETVYLSAAAFEALEFPLKSGYRCQLVRLTYSQQPDRVFAVLNEPLAVSLPGTQSVAVSSLPSVAVSNLPSASPDVTVSVAPVLSVSESEWLMMAGVAAVLCAFASFVMVGFALTRGGA